jgi:catechol 2,3-dioxygenase-like lactoylglutathione lyase family enzyme
VRGAVPTLFVENLDDAVRYYRETLGFVTVADHMATATCLMRGYGATVQLREAGPDARAGRPGCGHGWVDAILVVARPERVYEQWDRLGAPVLDSHDIGPGWTGCFAVIDCAGNVLAVASATRWWSRLGRALDGRLLALDRAAEDRRATREEKAHLAEFRAFYDGLPNKTDIVYMFFTAGLLHWAAKAIQYVPAEVNLVLLGSALPDDELDWLGTLGRPVHHVRLHIDDKTAWEFLFAANQRSFGWLDIDCLVLEPRLFAEIRDLRSSDAMNTVWYQDSAFGFPLACTYFTFVNIDAVRAVQATGLDVSPSVYSSRRFDRGVAGRACYSRPLRRRLRDRLLRVLPADHRGLPTPPAGMTMFDTTVVFQLVSRTLGYDVRQVRGLARRGQHREGPGTDAYEEISDELVHIGGVSYGNALTEFSALFHSIDTRLRYLVADYVALVDARPRLPQSYAVRLARVIEELDRLGIGTDAALDVARQHLGQARGLSAAAIEKVLRSAPQTSWTRSGLGPMT